MNPISLLKRIRFGRRADEVRGITASPGLCGRRECRCANDRRRGCACRVALRERGGSIGQRRPRGRGSRGRARGKRSRPGKHDRERLRVSVASATRTAIMQPRSDSRRRTARDPQRGDDTMRDLETTRRRFLQGVGATGLMAAAYHPLVASGLLAEYRAGSRRKLPPCRRAKGGASASSARASRASPRPTSCAGRAGRWLSTEGRRPLGRGS